MKIETPVTLDSDGDFVDANGVLIFIGSVMPEPTDAEVVKRINLHDGLVRALGYARDVIEGEFGRPCHHLEKIDAVLQLVGDVPPAQPAPVVIDLYHVALRAIRERYITAFGPLDPNLTSNDIDWYIGEIIAAAALPAIPEGMIDAMVEASNVLSGQAERREPLADELAGFALMVKRGVVNLHDDLARLFDAVRHAFGRNGDDMTAATINVLIGDLRRMRAVPPSLPAALDPAPTEDALREHLARVFDAMPAHETLRGSEIAGQIRAAMGGRMQVVFTDSQISAGARWMADHSAEQCNVDKDDNWKVYGQSFIDEFRAAIQAAVA